jgi:hypothetical protein
MPSRRTTDWDDRALMQRLQNMPRQADRALHAMMRYHAPRAERTLKTGARWTDRTGNARNGLFTTVIHEPFQSYGIVMAHGVPYGIWLEVRFSGRYAIITPTVQSYGPQVMQTVGTLFARMFGGPA